MTTTETSYILCSSLSGRSNTYIVPLRPADFLEAQPATKIFGGAGREGNAMFKYGRPLLRLLLRPARLELVRTRITSRPRTSSARTAPRGSSATPTSTSATSRRPGCSSRSREARKRPSSSAATAGATSRGNGIGYNEWMPLTFTGTTPDMQSLSEWSIDAATGAWAVGPGNNYVLNPSFEADRTTTSTPAGWTVGGGLQCQWRTLGKLVLAAFGLARSEDSQPAQRHLHLVGLGQGQRRNPLRQGLRRHRHEHLADGRIDLDQGVACRHRRQQRNMRCRYFQRKRERGRLRARQELIPFASAPHPTRNHGPAPKLAILNRRYPTMSCVRVLGHCNVRTSP